MLTKVIGILATIVGTCLMMPQAIKSFNTRQLGDVSWGTLVLYLLNCGLWLTYGIRKKDGPISTANSIGIIISLALLTMKIIWQGNG